MHFRERESEKERDGERTEGEKEGGRREERGNEGTMTAERDEVAPLDNHPEEELGMSSEAGSGGRALGRRDVKRRGIGER